MYEKKAQSHHPIPIDTCPKLPVIVDGVIVIGHLDGHTVVAVFGNADFYYGTGHEDDIEAVQRLFYRQETGRFRAAD